MSEALDAGDRAEPPLAPPAGSSTEALADTLPPEAPPNEPPAPRRSRLVTLLAALVLLPGLVIMTIPASKDSRLAARHDAERDLARIVGRTMDVREAIARRPPWQQVVSGVLGLESADDVDQAIGWYEELAAFSLDPRVDLHLAILQAETGHRDDVQRRVDEWRRRGEPFTTFASVLGGAYLGPSDGAVPTVGAVVDDWVREGWFRDRLLLAVARRLDQPDVVGRTSAALVARGDAVLRRVSLVVVAGLLVSATGLAVAVVVVRRLRRDPAALRAGTAPLPPPWTGRAGTAVILRGGALSVGVLFGGMLLAGFVGTPGLDWLAALEAPMGVFIALPTVLLARRHLFRPAGLRMSDGLGLRVVPGGVRRVLIASLAIVGVVAAGDVVLSYATDAVGASGHWTEWFDEDLVFGTPLAALTTVLAAVVVAGVTEELLFRGILFPTLRRRVKWPLAALLSALAFAALHGYTTQGFASVLLSGLVWAWAYERTGSLWPGIIGHAFGNLSASMLLLVTLRL